MAYIDTPRTEAGNATIMTNGHGLGDLSVENSFVVPTRKSEDLFATVRQGGKLSLRTPTVRQPLGDRCNVSKRPTQAEFTPLLKSVGKNNLQGHKEKLRGGPHTPAFLQDSFQALETPAIRNGDYSEIYVDENDSSMAGDENTPLPQVASSSAKSTPIATLPARDVNGPLDSQGVLTLKDQENVIDKIGKENFNLKLKIHFLEEALRKAGPGFHEAALKENTDLKVDKVSTQKELARAKRTLAKAEQELEAYKQHVQDMQDKMKSRRANEGLKDELQQLQTSLSLRETEVDQLKSKLELTEDEHANLEKCQNDVDDLEAELREKDRLIEDKDDEVDRLKSQLDAEKDRRDENQDQQEVLTELAQKLREAQDELSASHQEKQEAVQELEELRDEISNKSFTTKGLTRQLEGKAQKLEGDLERLRDQYGELETRLSTTSGQLRTAKAKLEEAESESDVKTQRLKDENELLRNDREAVAQRCQTLLDRAQELEQKLRSKSEEKDLLHSRHDMLTSESQNLQRDVARANSRIGQLQIEVEQERSHAVGNDKRLRGEAKAEFDRLTAEIDDLEKKLEDRESRNISDRDYWEAQTRDLQSQKSRSDEKAKGLQRTVDALQETQGSLSGQEAKLKQALESEKQRHEDEEAVLHEQIRDLRAEIDEKRNDLEMLRSEVAETRDDLRATERERSNMEEKVQELQDEVDVLQNGVDEDEGMDRQLNDLRLQLQQVEGDKNAMQDKLSTATADLGRFRDLCSQIEIEKNELQSRLHQMEGQLDDNRKPDQDKLELRTAKAKLDIEVSRLQKERRIILQEKVDAEDRLNEHIAQAASEDARFASERLELERKIAILKKDSDRDGIAARSRIQRLQTQVEQLEEQLKHGGDVDGSPLDLSILREDLTQARKKETELLHRESTMKNNLKDLRKKVLELERRAHEAEVSKLVHESSVSSTSGSAQKDELQEVRRQLTESRQKLNEFRTQCRRNEDTLRRKVSDLQQQEQAASRGHAEQVDMLEEELSKCREEKVAQEAKVSEMQNIEQQLQTRVKSLEVSLKSAPKTQTSERFMTDERKDLHEMIKAAKLESEDFQVQITSKDAQIKAYARREKHLVNDLNRVREQRLTHEGRTISLSSELDRLQLEYDTALERFTRKQKALEAERKAMLNLVRLEGTPARQNGLSDTGEVDVALRAKEKQHQLELKGLMKQMQWLKARFLRESNFRENLQYEKRYLNLEIDMYKSCNQIDLDLLAKMVKRPHLPERRKPGLKAAALMIIGTMRMQRMADEWAQKKQTRNALMKKWEEQKRAGKGKSIAKR